jgi:hypothetical protein
MEGQMWASPRIPTDFHKILLGFGMSAGLARGSVAVKTSSSQRISYGGVSYGRLPYRRASHGRASHLRVFLARRIRVARDV